MAEIGKTEQRHAELCERLEKVMDKAGWNKSQLARGLGVRPQLVSRLLSGGIMKLKDEYALNLQKDYGISASWLLTGVGQMVVDKPPPASLKTKILERDMVRFVNLKRDIFKISKEGTFDLSEASLDTEPAKGMIAHTSVTGKAQAWRVMDSGFAPRIRKGEIMVLETIEKLPNGADVLVVDTNNVGSVCTFLFAEEQTDTYNFLDVNGSGQTSYKFKKDIHQIFMITAVLQPCFYFERMPGLEEKADD